MIYIKEEPKFNNEGMLAYASQRIDRTNVFFPAMSGMGGRVSHLINGSRFVCGRKPANGIPYVFSDNDDSPFKEGRNIRLCERCYSGYNPFRVSGEQLMIDKVKLSQMHYVILSEAIRNALTIGEDRYSGVTQGMAIYGNFGDEDYAKAKADEITLNAFKLKGHRGEQSFTVKTGPQSFGPVMLESMPKSIIEEVTIGSIMMRHGQMLIVSPQNEWEDHLMIIFNSSTQYYLPCQVVATSQHEVSVTPLPYKGINYNEY